MMCPVCHGKRYLRKNPVVAEIEPSKSALPDEVKPCVYCAGEGSIYCCEGSELWREPWT